MNMKNKGFSNFPLGKKQSLAFVIGLLITIGVVLADVPTTMRMQHVVRNKTTNAVMTGDHDIAYRLVRLSDSSTLWNEDLVVTLDNGIASVLLGLDTPLDYSYFVEPVEWVLRIDSGTPIRYDETPYGTARVAEYALNVDWTNVSGKPAGLDTDSGDDYTTADFNTDYYNIGSRYDLTNFTTDHSSTTHSYIGNCSGANCNIGWGNLTGVPADIADGDDNTNNCSADGSCPDIVYSSETSAWDTNAADDFSGSYLALADRPAGLDDGDDDTTYSADEGNLTSFGNVFRLLKIDLAEMDNTLGWITNAVSNLANYFTKEEVAAYITSNISDHEDTFKHGNTTDEIRAQFSGGDNISIVNGVISISKPFSGWDTDVSDDFSGNWVDLADIPGDIADGDDNTNCSATGSCPEIAYNSELAYVGNCSGEGSCDSITYDNELDSGSIIRSWNTSWKVDNATNADLLAGQIPGYYLDDTTIGNCSGSGSCSNIVYIGDENKIVIAYQNISNIPTCKGSDKLTFDGTTLDCLPDAQGGGGGVGIWVTEGGMVVINTSVTGGIENVNITGNLKVEGIITEGSLGCGNITGAASNLCTITSSGGFDPSGLEMVNTTMLDNATVVRSWNTSWKVDNATNADTLAGQIPGYYLDDTTIGNCSLSGSCPGIAYDTELIGNCSIYDSCPSITYDSDLAYIGNCSGANCNIGWGNLTSVPADIADGDSDTTYDSGEVYIYESSDIFYLNETKLNQTTDARYYQKTEIETKITSANTSMKTYVDAQDISTNTSMKTYVDAQDEAQNECSEITGCVDNAFDNVANFTGTLVDTNWCVYDEVNGEINCNVEPVTNTDYCFEGNCGGDLVIDGSLTILGEYVNATVEEQYLNGSFLPNLPNQFDIGASGMEWANVYASNVYADTFYGTLDGAYTTANFSGDYASMGAYEFTNFSDDLGSVSWSGDLGGTGLSPTVVNTRGLSGENITSGFIADARIPGNIARNSELIGNCSVDQSCDNVVYTTDKLGNTTEEIWSAISNQTWDTRIDAVNDTKNVESLGFNVTIDLKAYFDTLYMALVNLANSIQNQSIIRSGLNESWVNDTVDEETIIRTDWTNITYDTEFDNDTIVRSWNTSWIKANQDNFDPSGLEIVNTTMLNNATIVRSWNTSWIKDNQGYNTSTEIFNAVNNGTFVMNNSDATLINLTIADSTGLGMNIWFNGSGICMGTC